MSLPAGRWPTGPSTVYSSSVGFAWCRFPKLRRLSSKTATTSGQWKQRCMFLVWSMEREHVLYLTNEDCRFYVIFLFLFFINEDTARSLSDQWRHCTLFIWPLETLHVLYLLYLTNGDSARCLSSLSDQWRHCTFFIWQMETPHVLYPYQSDTSRSLSDHLKQYTLLTLQAPGASQNQCQAKRFLRDLKHEWSDC